MLKNLMLGATALAAVAIAAPEMASARPGGGFGGGHFGGAHFSGGGGGFHGGSFGGGARFSGGGFRGASVAPSFRSAAVPNMAFRSAAVGAGAGRFTTAPNARYAGNWNGHWNGRHYGWRRGLGYGGLALGLAAAPYYYNNYYGYPYDDTYAYYGDDYYADNGYVVADDQDASCYVRRRIHTRYGWRLRTVNVCG